MVIGEGLEFRWCDLTIHNGVSKKDKIREERPIA